VLLGCRADRSSDHWRGSAPVAQRARGAKENLFSAAIGATILQGLPDSCAARSASYHRLVMASLATPGTTTIERLKQHPDVRQVPSPKIEMITIPAFLPPELCGALMALIDTNRRPSTIADPNGDDYFRTSETCDLDPNNPAVQELERLLFDLNGIDPAHGEPVQGQRYEVGQEFKQHTDYFEPSGADFEKYCGIAGNRTWTFMAYLNDVDAGGATRFKVIDKMFKPEQGRLVGWNNRRPDNSLNAATLHHAMKVRKGLKYVITKWYRERPCGW
jgi:prolyl 4-hydroxylase